MKPSPVHLRGRPTATGLLLLETEPNFSKNRHKAFTRYPLPGNDFIPEGIATAAYNRITLVPTVDGESDGEGEGPDGPSFSVTIEGTNGDPNDPTTGWFSIDSISDGDGPEHVVFQAQYIRARVTEFEAGEGDGVAVVDVVLWYD